MGAARVFIVVSFAVGTLAYLPSKDHYFSEALLQKVMEGMGRDLDTYLEEMGGEGRLSMGSRSDKDVEDAYYQDSPPAIRDQEYLQHSSLWASRYMQDNEGSQTKTGSLKSQMKQDNSLPAYCNPPNPCPVGYTASEGCLEEFTNTAAFSREYQSQQECMCDTEHMFDCSPPQENEEINEFNRLVRQFEVEDEHKSLVAKKFHVKKDWNPYLLGEKLPVAAKKGQHMVF